VTGVQTCALPISAVSANGSAAHTFPMLHAILEENESDTGQNKCFFLEMKAHLLSSQEELSRYFLETSHSSGQFTPLHHRHTTDCAKGIYT
jgi:hypothetical protein